MAAVTSTRTWQLATAAVIVAPETTTLEAPAAAVTVKPGAAKAPPAGQLVWMFGVAATRTLPGRLSVKPMPACAGLVPELVIVKVSVEVPPAAIVVGLNALLSVGGSAVTTTHWSVAVLVALVVVMLAARLVKFAAGH